MSGSFAYLLDTIILSDLVRNPSGAVATQITKAGDHSVCTSIVVAAELRYGALKSGSPKLAERVDQISLGPLPKITPAGSQDWEGEHVLYISDFIEGFGPPSNVLGPFSTWETCALPLYSLLAVNSTLRYVDQFCGLSAALDSRFIRRILSARPCRWPRGSLRRIVVQEKSRNRNHL
ncbi:MAG: PIN domain-containing protein [Pseudomonadota bacterium]